MNPIEIRTEFDQVLIALEGKVDSCLADFDSPMRIDIKAHDTKYVLKCFEKNYPANWEISYPIISPVDQEIDYDCIPALSHLEVIKWIEVNLK